LVIWRHSIQVYVSNLIADEDGCFNGWEVTLDNTGRVITKTEIAGQPQLIKKPTSWPAFLTFWEDHFSKVVIQRSSEDICDECFVFANQHRYGERKKKEPTDEELSDEEDNNLTALVSEVMLDDDDADDQEAMETAEARILAAGKHVERARKQRELFNQKKQQAKEERDNPRSQRTFCFCADFAQNMNLPNFASEQPGATYYFTPMSVYPFGIVDCSTEPSELTAYCYYEGEAKKGGNSVCSILWKYVLAQGLLDGSSKAKEINFVFDNCGGQNKNKMVLRFMIMLAKLGIADVVRAIFLIKGHTKNDCDRMFNLLKYDYRNTNVYTPMQLIECINKHPQVTAIAMETDEDFLEFSSLQDMLMIKAIHGCSKHHVFTVHGNNANKMIMQEANGEDMKELVVVLPVYQGDNVNWRKTMMTMDVSLPPGLPDIKWVELYSKWGRFIPEEVKPLFKYYYDKPPKIVAAEVKRQAKEAQRSRQSRGRTTTTGIHGANVVVKKQ
jgi:hypothetical protein